MEINSKSNHQNLQNFNIAIQFCPFNKYLYFLELESNSICILNKNCSLKYYGINENWYNQYFDIDQCFKRGYSPNDSIKQAPLMNMDNNFKKAIRNDVQQYYNTQECFDQLYKPVTTLLKELDLLTQIDIKNNQIIKDYRKSFGNEITKNIKTSEQDRSKRIIAQINSQNIKSSQQTNQNTSKNDQLIFKDVSEIKIRIKFFNQIKLIPVNPNMLVTDVIQYFSTFPEKYGLDQDESFETDDADEFIDESDHEEVSNQEDKVETNSYSGKVSSVKSSATLIERLRSNTGGTNKKTPRPSLTPTQRTGSFMGYGDIKNKADAKKYVLKAADCNQYLIDNRPLIEYDYISYKMRFNQRISLNLVCNKYSQYDTVNQGDNEVAQTKGNVINVAKSSISDAFLGVSKLLKNGQLKNIKTLMYPLLQKDRFKNYFEKNKNQILDVNMIKFNLYKLKEINNSKEDIQILYAQINENQLEINKDLEKQNNKINMSKLNQLEIDSSNETYKFKNLFQQKPYQQLYEQWNKYNKSIKFHTQPNRYLYIKFNKISNLMIIFASADVFRNSLFTDAESLCTHIPTIKKLKKHDGDEEEETTIQEKFKKNVQNFYEKQWLKLQNINYNKLKRTDFNALNTQLRLIFDKTKIINNGNQIFNPNKKFYIDFDEIISIADKVIPKDKIQELQIIFLYFQINFEPQLNYNQHNFKFKLNKILKGLQNLPFEPHFINIQIELSNADQIIDTWNSELYDFNFDININDEYVLDKFNLEILPFETAINLSVYLWSSDKRSKQSISACTFQIYDHNNKLNKGLFNQNLFPFSRNKSYIKCMRDFTGLKFNKENFDAFNLSFMHEYKKYLNVNQDMPDKILTHDNFNEETDQELSNQDDQDPFYRNQCLNDRYSVEWTCEINLTQKFQSLNRPLRDSTLNEQNIDHFKKSNNNIRQTILSTQDGLINGDGRKYCPSDINFPHLVKLANPKEYQFDYTKINFEINDQCEIPITPQDSTSANDTDFFFQENPSANYHKLSNMNMSNTTHNNEIHVEQSDSEEDQDDAVSQANIENEESTMHEFQNIECSFDSCNFRENGQTDVYADDIQAVSILNLYEDVNIKDNQVIQGGFRQNQDSKKISKEYDQNNISEMKNSVLLNKQNIIESFNQISQSYEQVLNNIILKPQTEFEMTTLQCIQLLNVRFYLIHETQMLPQQLMVLERMGDYKTDSQNPKQLLRNEIKASLIEKIICDEKGSLKIDYGFQTCMLGQMLSDTEMRDWLVIHYVQKLDDQSLDLYLNFLITNLFYERKHESELANFLIKRAALNQKFIGKQFQWKLKAQMHINFCAERIGIILKRQIMLTSWINIIYESEPVSQSNNICENVKETEIVSKIYNLSTWMVENDSKNEKDKLQHKLKELDSINHYISNQTRNNQVFSLPCKQNYDLMNIESNKCSILSSKKKPIFLNMNTVDESTCFLIQKTGDDLRQDLIVLSFYKIIDQQAMKSGLDLKLNTYKVETTGQEEGFIEVVVNSKNFSAILSSDGAWNSSKESQLYDFQFPPSLKNTEQSCEKERAKENERKHTIISNFSASCAGYCILTWIMGIADRHPSNMMLRVDNGCFFHIDFGHFLGNFKSKFGIKRENSEFFQSTNFEQMMKEGNQKNDFMKYCDKTLKILRKNGNFIVQTLMNAVVLGIPELTSKKDIEWVEQRLNLNQNDYQTFDNFTKVMDEARDDTIRKMDNLIHNLRHYGGKQ